MWDMRFVLMTKNNGVNTMSLDKAIENGKEKRKQYKGAKADDSTCRNHGSCVRCKSNRLYQRNKTDEASRQALEENEEDYRYENDVVGD